RARGRGHARLRSLSPLLFAPRAVDARAQARAEPRDHGSRRARAAHPRGVRDRTAPRLDRRLIDARDRSLAEALSRHAASLLSLACARFHAALVTASTRR